MTGHCSLLLRRAECAHSSKLPEPDSLGLAVQRPYLMMLPGSLSSSSHSTSDANCLEVNGSSKLELPAGRRVVVVEKIDAAVCVPVSSLFSMTESLMCRCQKKRIKFAILDCQCLCANRAHNLLGNALEDTRAMRKQQLTRSRVSRYRGEKATQVGKRASSKTD